MVNWRRLILLLIILLLLPLSIYLVLRITHYFGKAAGTSANLLIDAGSSFDVSKKEVWKDLAQGGEQKGRMLSTVVSNVAKLKPQYIRIDHIYDNYDAIGRDSSGNLTFNWSSLDQTISDIRATGALPFLSLSYLPPVLSPGGKINDEPQNWTDWELVIQRTVEHVSGKNGLNLSGVYYEVWNEPDLFGKYKISGNKNYMDLYVHSVAGAQRAAGVNSFKIGGPATTGLYQSWFDALLKAREQGLRLDFFSWHLYSKNLDDFEQNALEIQKWLSNYPNSSQVELIISESGINSENDPAYDNKLSAVHTIASAAILEGVVNKLFSFEVKDGPSDKKYWGRWGILTNEQFGTPEEKIRFHAFEFLNQMTGGKVNIAGTGSWIKAFAKEDGRIIKVLVVNYDSSGSHLEAVPMNFVNLPFTDFTFRRSDFLGGTTDLPVSTSSATWRTVQVFDPNSASIFEIIPK